MAGSIVKIKVLVGSIGLDGVSYGSYGGNNEYELEVGPDLLPVLGNFAAKGMIEIIGTEPVVPQGPPLVDVEAKEDELPEVEVEVEVEEVEEVEEVKPVKAPKTRSKQSKESKGVKEE